MCSNMAAGVAPVKPPSVNGHIYWPPQLERLSRVAKNHFVRAASTVRFSINPQSQLSPAEQIREQLLYHIHLGILRPGSRLPTVRDVATQTGLNLKTAFRAYRKLAKEGVVDIKPTRGVFVKYSTAAAERSYRRDLERFARRVLREGEQYSLSPRRVAQSLLHAAGIRAPAVRCAVLECNHEQAGLFSEEIHRKLGIEAFPVLTTEPAKKLRSLLRDADLLVTTDFHWAEATAWGTRLRREPFRIGLNPEFHRILLRHARRHVFPMVLSDISFEPQFRQAVGGTAPEAVVNNLVFVHYRDHARLAQLLAEAPRAYVSPLIMDEVARHAPASVQLVTLRDMIAPESLALLRHKLLLNSR